jgi:hypothetical protein
MTEPMQSYWTSNAGVRWRCQHCGAGKELGKPCPNEVLHGVCPASRPIPKTASGVNAGDASAQNQRKNIPEIIPAPSAGVGLARPADKKGGA